MKDKNIVSLQSVSKTYKINAHSSVGVKDITLNVSHGELVLFLGPSGSGKTTLLTLIAGLLKPSEGIISLFGKTIEFFTVSELQKLRTEKIGFIFQTFLLIDSLTALQNVELVLRFASKSKREVRRIAENIFRELNIEYLAHKLPTTMSQGEKQRVAVTRAIANNADLILADEPTASLDTENGSIIIEWLNTYAKANNKCVIVVSHDLRLKEYAHRIIYLEDGRIINT
ncbi:MAG: ABC transporter ATP-binding protein [Ignavibacterium sp.]|jgi:putative ABC transport system ATP-binding protein|nr:MAG: ABC transporter ATP-binding protein [Ignavibacterium sp.]MDD5607673.1 ABC transporter ATP-binding protein [Ignavibacterium sp.]MDX9713249.1 ABC transporter ATP-binding protein [Ignavibacteriaceae bacterium]